MTINTLSFKTILYPLVFGLFAQTSYGEGLYNESIYNGETLVAVDSGSSSVLSNTGMMVLAFVALGILLILAGILVSFLRKRSAKK